MKAFFVENEAYINTVMNRGTEINKQNSVSLPIYPVTSKTSWEGTETVSGGIVCIIPTCFNQNHTLVLVCMSLVVRIGRNVM